MTLQTCESKFKLYVLSHLNTSFLLVLLKIGYLLHILNIINSHCVYCKYWILSRMSEIYTAISHGYRTCRGNLETWHLSADYDNLTGIIYSHAFQNYSHWTCQLDKTSDGWSFPSDAQHNLQTMFNFRDLFQGFKWLMLWDF